jgi:hypothetical protein
MPRLPLAFLLSGFLVCSPALAQDEKAKKEPTAFEFERLGKKVKHDVDLKEIVKGLRVQGDPRDKLPPIYKPKIVSAKDAAKFLNGSDRVLGVVVGKESRAYPIFIMQVHEMCNDTLGGRPIAPNY